MKFLTNNFLERYIEHIFYLFILFNFINRDISNILLIILLLISLILIKSNSTHKNIINSSFVIISCLFVICILLNTIALDGDISQIDTYSRLLLLLPIYFMFSNKLFSSDLFFKYILYTIYISFIYYLVDKYIYGYDGRYMGSSNTSITFANMIIIMNLFILINISDKFLKNKSSIKFLAPRFIAILLTFFLWGETESRGAFIGYIFALIPMFILFKKHSIKILAIIVLLLPIIFVTGIPDRIINTYYSLNSINIDMLEDSIEFNTSENERIYYIKFAYKKMIENPLYGIGPTNYEFEMEKDLRKNNLAINFRSHAHNEFLDIGSKFGIMSLILYILLLISTLYIFIKNKDFLFAKIGIVTISSNIGFMMTQSQFAHHQSTVFFLLLLYLALSQTRRRIDSNTI